MGGRTWRQVSLPIAASFAAASLVPAAIAQQTPAIDSIGEQDYDIQAQPLDQALQDYVRTSGVNLLYPQGLTAGRRSTTVRGRLTRQAALRAMLEGSGLVARFVRPRSAVLFPAGSPPPDSTPAHGAPSLQLDMAEVRARSTIGGTDARAMQAYGDAARSEIRAALARDPKLRREALQFDLTISVDAEGRIVNPRINGNAPDLGQVRTLIDGLQLSQPPPSHERMWLRFTIAANGAAPRETPAK